MDDLKKEIKQEEKARKDARIPWQDVVDKTSPNTCKSHDFYFSGSGGKVQCKCGVGYQLPWNGTLRDGHIYIDNQLLI